MKDLSEKLIKKVFKNLVLSIILLLMLCAFIESGVLHGYTFYKMDCKTLMDRYDKESPDMFGLCLGIIIFSFIVFPVGVFLTADKSGEWCEITEETLIKLRGKMDTDKLSALKNIRYSKERLTEKLSYLNLSPEENELILTSAEKITEKDLHKGLMPLIPYWMRLFTKVFYYYAIVVILYTLYIAYTEGFHTLRLQSAELGHIVFSIRGKPLTAIENDHLASYIVRIIFSYLFFSYFYLIMVLYGKIKDENSDLSLLISGEFIKFYIKPAFIISIISLILSSVIHICIYVKVDLGVKFPLIYPSSVIAGILTLLSVRILQIYKSSDDENKSFWFFWLNVDRAPFWMSSLCMLLFLYIIYIISTPFYMKTAGTSGKLFSSILIYFSVLNLTALSSKSIYCGCKLIPSKEEIDELLKKIFVNNR